MRSACATTRNMPLDRLPSKHRALADQALSGQDERTRRESDTRGRKAEAVIEAGTRQLRDKVGVKNLTALREAMQHERGALRERREPPTGLGLDVAGAHKARKKRIDALVRRLGIDPKVLRGIHDATRAKLLAAFDRPGANVTPGMNLHHNLAQWQALSPLHQYPLDWGVRPPNDPDDPSQFQVFGPDFSLWNLQFDATESDNFVVRRETTLYEHSGVIGNIATMDCNDADGWDLADAVVDTELVFIYQAPRAGRLEVIVDAMNAFGHHDLTIADEFGWSNHWTHQHNYLSLNVFHPAITERSLAQMSEFKKDENEDNTWSVRALTPGNHYYGHMVSNGSVQAGDTFFVGVGTRTFDITRADDVEVHSRSNFQWWIRSAEVRIVT